MNLSYAESRGKSTKSTRIPDMRYENSAELTNEARAEISWLNLCLARRKKTIVNRIPFKDFSTIRQRKTTRNITEAVGNWRISAPIATTDRLGSRGYSALINSDMNLSPVT